MVYSEQNGPEYKICTKFTQFPLRERMYIFDSIYFKCQSCLLSKVHAHSNCLKIEQVQGTKYLGVQIDENVNWRAHITSLKKYKNTALRKFFFLSSTH